jgi:hypothetical protein
MRNPIARPTARRRLLASAVLAVGLAAAVSAYAQTGVAPTTPPPPATPQPAAAPATPDPGALGGITVESGRRDPLRYMDPKKRAEFDAEAAKQDAARHYRTSMPPLAADSKGISDPNDMSVDYPGLHTLAPPSN